MWCFGKCLLMAMKIEAKPVFIGPPALPKGSYEIGPVRASVRPSMTHFSQKPLDGFS